MKGRIFRPAPDRRRVAKALIVATFSLLWAACSEASANCRDDVAAAFAQLKTSGRPYRKEVTSIFSDPQIFHGTVKFHGTVEVVPPDRMREVGSYDYGTAETIRVGQQAWSNRGWPWAWPWGWSEWDPRHLQAIIDEGKDVSTLPDRPIPADAVFECLGRIEFKDISYFGYRSQMPRAILSLSIGPLSEAKQEELTRRIQQMPQQWRTVFLDPQSMLPAHDLVAEENQLDSPRLKVQYTYPNSIKIAPPLWCRIGACPVEW